MRVLLLLIVLFISACSTITSLPSQREAKSYAPDYFAPDSWAALPTKADNADRTPADTMPDRQASAEADVFFLHPTTYTEKRKKNDPWNASIYDIKLNKKTDDYPILYQASLFNAAGRVYAPRYRQAHLSAYFLEDTIKQKEIFDIAYNDVKRAFVHYLKHYNKNRPIIIASHSQGTTHAKRLLREFFDGKPLQNQLVAAYLVGIPVEADYFSYLKPCDSATDNGCFMSWRTYQKGRYPKWHKPGTPVVVTNPLTWSSDTSYAEKTLNNGGVLYKYNVILPAIADAQVHDGLLWINKPKFPGSFLWWNPNYHAGDYNLFYLNVRYNARQRVQSYLSNK
ncbi:MAG: DUF3089 domain-containing protein [Saprospiraceae bacterium]